MADTNDLTQNVTLFNNAKSKNVTVITDGSNERLAVDSFVSNSVGVKSHQPKAIVDVTGTATNTSTDISLGGFTGRGELAFIAVAGSNSNYEIAIEVDGVEEFRATMSNIGTDLGLANGTNVPVWVETANKNFRLHPNSPVGFTTNFEIFAKATTTPVATLKWVITYGEEES